MPGSFYSNSQPALMLGTCAGLATGFDFAALSQKSAQGGYVFVIDGLGFFQAEGTYFAPWCESPPAMPPPGTLLLSSVLLFTHRYSIAPFAT